MKYKKETLISFKNKNITLLEDDNLMIKYMYKFINIYRLNSVL
jgi:hypothetical protein